MGKVVFTTVSELITWKWDLRQSLESYVLKLASSGAGTRLSFFLGTYRILYHKYIFMYMSYGKVNAKNAQYVQIMG